MFDNGDNIDCAIKGCEVKDCDFLDPKNPTKTIPCSMFDPTDTTTPSETSVPSETSEPAETPEPS